MFGQTTPARYGSKHQQVRKQVERSVVAGLAVCARCGGPIFPDEPWDLDHADGDGDGYLGPSHARCNRATAGGARRSRGRGLLSRPQPSPPVSREVREDDPEKGVYWGPPDPRTGHQLRWSQPWFEWRGERR